MNTNSSSKKTTQSSVQSVERALQLLKLIAQQSVPIKTATLAELSGLNRATVWRLIGTLENSGFIARDERSKGYALGLASTELCTKTANLYAPLMRIAQSTMQDLWKETKESIILAVARHSGVFTIDQLDSPHAIRLKSYVNSSTPLHCSSNGKVLLAHLPKKELDNLLKRPLELRTKHTIVDPILLRNELETVYRNGYGIVCEELSEQEHGISAPILKDGRIIAFLNVSGPSFRLTLDKMHEIAPRLKEACTEIASAIPDNYAL